MLLQMVNPCFSKREFRVGIVTENIGLRLCLVITMHQHLCPETGVARGMLTGTATVIKAMGRNSIA